MTRPEIIPAWAEQLAGDFAPDSETIMYAHELMQRVVPSPEWSRLFVAVCVKCAKDTNRTLIETVSDVIKALENR